MGLPVASPAVRREWFRRVEAEYRSASLTQHFGLWLLQMGASPDLLLQSQRIVADELVHSELSLAVYVAAGGTEAPVLDRSALTLHRAAETLEEDVLCQGALMFCFGETVAVHLFQRMRECADVPVARTALDRILRDEVFHRDFGWTLLTWLLQQPQAPRYRTLLQQQLAAMFQVLRENYGGEGSEGAEEDRRWGLIPRSLYRDAVEETVRRDFRPRWAALGLDFDAAVTSGT